MTENRAFDCLQVEVHLGVVSCSRSVGGPAAALAEAAVGVSNLGRAPPCGPILAVLPHIYAAPIEHLQAQAI